jgi:hypothetical protein
MVCRLEELAVGGRQSQQGIAVHERPDGQHWRADDAPDSIGKAAQRAARELQPGAGGTSEVWSIQADGAACRDGPTLRSVTGMVESETMVCSRVSISVAQLIGGDR